MSNFAHRGHLGFGSPPCITHQASIGSPTYAIRSTYPFDRMYSGRTVTIEDNLSNSKSNNNLGNFGGVAMHRKRQIASFLTSVIAISLTALVHAQPSARNIMELKPTHSQSGYPASLSPAGDAKIRTEVDEIMRRVLARDYSVRDGWTTGHKPVKGIGVISWLPPTAEDSEEIAKLGVQAIPELTLYVSPDAKPGGFVQLLAVKFLAVIETSATIPSLANALDPKNWSPARIAALEALGDRPEAEAVALIRSEMTDRDPEISQRAIQLMAGRREVGTP